MPSASFIKSDEVHHVSFNHIIDSFYLYIAFAIMVDLSGWNLIRMFHVPNVDVNFG